MAVLLDSFLFHPHSILLQTLLVLPPDYPESTALATNLEQVTDASHLGNSRAPLANPLPLQSLLNTVRAFPSSAQKPALAPTPLRAEVGHPNGSA